MDGRMDALWRLMKRIYERGSAIFFSVGGKRLFKRQAAG